MAACAMALCHEPLIRVGWCLSLSGSVHAVVGGCDPEGGGLYFAGGPFHAEANLVLIGKQRIRLGLKEADYS